MADRTELCGQKTWPEINFSSSHAKYFSVWKYTTKDDKEYLESKCRPDLKNAPQTQKASQTRIAEMGGSAKRAEKEKTRTAAPAVDL